MSTQEIIDLIRSATGKYSIPRDTVADALQQLLDGLYQGGSLIPSADEADLGTDEHRFRDLYLAGTVSANNIQVGDIAVAKTHANSGLHTIAMGGKFNFGNGNIQTITLTGNMSLAFENFKIGVFKLIVKQDSTGGRLLTFSNALKSGAFLTIANNIDVVDIVCDGVTVYCGITNNYRT